MRIISYNVNGIRAAIKKGFLEWLSSNPADVICLQEIKATAEDVDTKLFEKAGYSHYWFSAQKKGYSGVAVLTKIKPNAVKTGTGHHLSDSEGRVIELQFGDIKIINAYFPSGTSGDERQSYKYQWLDEIMDYLKKEKKKNPKIILCGDYNIAHNEIDIHDPEPHRYSWWSQRFPSVRLNNKGWRIDYINATDALKNNLLNAEIYPEIKHSDHCPVYLEIKM